MPRLSIKTSLRQRIMHMKTDIDRLRGVPVLRQKFLDTHGYPLNLEDPKTFNEKMQWRKLYDRNPLFPILMDKANMPDWARSKLPTGFHRHLPQFLQVVESADQIDFAKLPGNLALKANHASGWNILLRDGTPYEVVSLRRNLNRWLARKYGKNPQLHEWGYLNIPPRICVQEMALKADGSLPNDIRFHMFGDQVGFCRFDTVDLPGGKHATILDENWQPSGFTSSWPTHDVPPQRPEGFEDMLQISKLLGAHLDFMRVDFLSDGSTFFLNELTLYSSSGLRPIRPLSFDRTLGDMWQLPMAAR